MLYFNYTSRFLRSPHKSDILTDRADKGKEFCLIFFLRIADCHNAIRTEAIFYSKKLTHIILSLRTIRLCLVARTAIAMYPAAHQIHGGNRKLHECRRNRAVVHPEVCLGLIAKDNNSCRRTRKQG